MRKAILMLVFLALGGLLHLIRSPGNPGRWVEARSGCSLWSQNPQPGEIVNCSGGCCADGRASGAGKVEWRYDGKVDYFDGELRGGKANGHGTYTYANGEKYVGEFRDDKFNGRGSATYANGDWYVGEWKDNKRNGQGTHYVVNGSVVHTGIWKDDNLVSSQPKP